MSLSQSTGQVTMLTTSQRWINTGSSEIPALQFTGPVSQHTASYSQTSSSSSKVPFYTVHWTGQ